MINDSLTKAIGKYYYNQNEKLGQGSFGSVYLGRHVDDNSSLYAIKVIPITMLQNDPALKESILNEMKVMNLLKHDNIVRCYDVLSSVNNHYFILEYCPNGTLADHLKARGRLSEHEALNIFIQLLKGYYEMLKLGIIHRDLKPANILIKNNVFKLADFGFSKCVENFTKDILKSLVGTPLYMPPQILQNQQYSTKADLWSLALIYYEMLVGRTPWPAKTHMDLVNKILTQPLSFPRDVKLSAETKEFLIGALQLEENKRFSWEEVFSHRLFKDCFEYKRRKSEMLKQANNLQGILKERIIEMNIDLYKLFNEIDKNGNNELEMNEFAILLKKVDSKISREEIEFIFNSIDEDGNNVISLYEFRKWLSSQQGAKNIAAPNQKNNNEGRLLKRQVTQPIDNNNVVNPNNVVYIQNAAPQMIIDGRNNRSYSALQPQFMPPPGHTMPHSGFHPPPLLPLLPPLGYSGGNVPRMPPPLIPPFGHQPNQMFTPNPAQSMGFHGGFPPPPPPPNYFRHF